MHYFLQWQIPELQACDTPAKIIAGKILDIYMVQHLKQFLSKSCSKKQNPYVRKQDMLLQHGRVIAKLQIFS